MINAIVCVDKNWGIGKKNGLLFHLPLDLKFFKNVTKYRFVVFGYNTYMSLPKRPLKDRTNIVLWDKAKGFDDLEDCITFNNFEQMIKFLKILSKTEEIFICGGGMLYASCLEYCDSIFVTKVDAEDPEATVFFPNLDEDKRFEMRTELASQEDSGYSLKFTIYNKIKENK